MPSLYLGPPLKDQTPPERILPPHLQVVQVAPGACAGDAAKPYNHFVFSRNAPPAVPVPDPPGAQRRSTRGSEGPRAGTKAAQIVAWVASQPGPVRGPALAAAIPGASGGLAKLITAGHLIRRRYRTADGHTIVQYMVPGRRWPALPHGAQEAPR